MNTDERRRYRETPKWRRLSAETIGAAGGFCEICLSATALHAHHLDQGTYGYEDEVPNCLVAVCEECHKTLCHPEWKERRRTRAG